MASADEFTGPTTELLQQLIRNECVNDGTPDSGEETRNADLLAGYLEGVGLDVERFTPREGRDSIVARIEGTDPDAPSLCLMGHTDVVPVNPAGWDHDPFAGEVIDGEVWGRGALDMLNLTSSMAVVVRRLAAEGFRPKGDLVYFGVGDEEAGGVYGAEWIAEHHWEAIAADYVLTELGGWSTVDAAGTRTVTVNVGEKGLAWRRLRIGGTPGHGSMPYGADNALVTAAEVVTRALTSGGRSWPRSTCPSTCATACRRPIGSMRHSRRFRCRWPACATPRRTRRSPPTSATVGRRRTRSPTSSKSTSTSARCRAPGGTASMPTCAPPSATSTTASR